MDKGILICAIGHPYWGRMAENLAMSLKFSAPDVKITLAAAEGAETDIVLKNLFHKIIQIPQSYYHLGAKKEPVMVKSNLDRLSPYSKTLYLDADTVWLPRRSVNNLFEDLKDLDFTMQNRGFQNLENPTKGFGVWAETENVKKAYKFKKGKYYNLSSEVVYFTKKAKPLFIQVRKDYKSLKVTPRFFQGGFPDEIVFSIAMIKTNTYPHRDNWRASYWESDDKRRLDAGNGVDELYSQYYLYSMGGATTTPPMKKFYDNLILFYSNQLKYAYPYKYKDKHSWVQGRTTI